MTDNCKHVSKIKTSIQLGILSPERWHCQVCNTTECVWACLSCPNFACGRYIAEHALHHYQTTGHPLCIEVNEKFVFCYICDDFVLNDNAPGDIKLLRMALDAVADQNFEELSKEKRARRILRYHIRDAKKVARRLLRADDIQTAVMRHRTSRLSWALRLWWKRYVEKKRLTDGNLRLRASSNKFCAALTSSPALTGLRNLGNTCYMNSVLQILRHTAPFANFVLNHPPSEVLAASRKRRTQTQQKCDESTSKDQLASDESVTDAKSIYDFPEASVRLSTLSPSYVPHITTPTPSKTSSSSENVVNVANEKISASPQLGELGGGLNGGRCTVSAADRGPTDALPVTTANDDSSILDQGSVYEELYKLLQLLWSAQRTVVSPSSLVYTIWNALPLFKGYRQQDAQEFLSMFLDRLQSEMHGTSSTVQLHSRDFVNRTFQGYCVSHIRCNNCNAVACTEEPFSELSLALPPDCYNGESQECDLVELIRQFVGATPIDGKGYACRECATKDDCNNSICSLKSLNTSNTCTRNSLSPRGLTPYKVDKLVSVSLSRLPTPSPDQCPRVSRRLNFDVTQSPSSSTSSENKPTAAGDTIDGKSVQTAFALASPEQFSPIQTLTSATQTIRLTRLPRVLRLHIKRFRWVGRQREKLSCHVSFPLILDLSEFMLNDADRSECTRTHTHDLFSQSVQDNSPAGLAENRKHLYHLTGVIVHHGRGFQSGHYTAYCLNDQPECWLSCNDANVTFSDFSEVASSQAYLLFYSELMPGSPFPNWLKASPNSSLHAGLKRCYSNAFTGTPHPPVPVVQSPTCSDSTHLKRTASTPTDSNVSLASAPVFERASTSGTPIKKTAETKPRRTVERNQRHSRKL